MDEASSRLQNILHHIYPRAVLQNHLDCTHVQDVRGLVQARAASLAASAGVGSGSQQQLAALGIWCSRCGVKRALFHVIHRIHVDVGGVHGFPEAVHIARRGELVQQRCLHY